MVRRVVGRAARSCKGLRSGRPARAPRAAGEAARRAWSGRHPVSGRHRSLDAPAAPRAAGDCGCAPGDRDLRVHAPALSAGEPVLGGQGRRGLSARHRARRRTAGRGPRFGLRPHRRTPDRPKNDTRGTMRSSRRGRRCSGRLPGARLLIAGDGDDRARLSAPSPIEGSAARSPFSGGWTTTFWRRCTSSAHLS